jgi:hypothetical protein
LELDRRGAELLFGRSPSAKDVRALPSQATPPSANGARTFNDPWLCAATVDRLTFDASIIETGAESFRPRTTKRRRGPDPAT